MAFTPSKTLRVATRSQGGAGQPLDTAHPRRTCALPLVTAGLVLLVFCVLQASIPLRTAVQIGADEGFELAKTTLCLKGYQLYTDVWCDHPPLHTVLLTQVAKHISPSVAGPRLVTVGFAALLLLSSFVIALRIAEDRAYSDSAGTMPTNSPSFWAAGLSTAMLMASPGFLELSASCMMEIPALAPPVMAICVLLYGRSTKWRQWEILAGILFGVGLGMKLLGAMLLPLALLILWLQDRELPTLLSSDRGWSPSAAHSPSRDSRKFTRRSSNADAADEGQSAVRGKHRHRSETGAPSMNALNSLGVSSLILLACSALVLGLSAAITFVGLDFLIDRGAFLRHFHQSWASHFTSTASFEFGSPNDHRFPPALLLRNWDLTIPALLGVILLLRRARQTPMALFPIAWLALAFGVIATHTPWWSYYYIHLAIPLSLCAGCGIALSIGALRTPSTDSEADNSTTSDKRTASRKLSLPPAPGRGRRTAFALVLVYLLCALPWMGTRLYLQITGIRDSPQTHYALVLDEIRRYKPFAEWLYTDNLTYSFHTGIPVPPQLAVVSLKRLWSGEITMAGVAAEVRKFKPGVIALRNDTREVPFQDLLDAEYRLVYRDAGNRLYAHRSIANKPKP